MFVGGLLAILVAVGVGAGYVLSFRPLYLAHRAGAWTPTACEVISSRAVHDGQASLPEIVYRYSIGGRQYTADRYDFLPNGNGDPRTPGIVASHPPGARFECYVDPEDPTSAVINRTPTPWHFMGLVFFALFAGIPAGIGLRYLRARSAKPVLVAPAGTAVGAGLSDGPLVLESTASPLTMVLVVGLICLVWNGLVGVFTYYEIRSFADGRAAPLLVFLVTLFQIIGLALLGALAYQLLALANPRPSLSLSRGFVPLGGSVPFTWTLRGAAHRVTALQITLRGREEASLATSKEKRVFTQVFFTATLVDATQAPSIAHGSGAIHVPADSMHSFTALHNKVIWTLDVVGTIPRWPDIDQTFEVTVRPV